MSFLHVIDMLIVDLNSELEKVKRARTNKEHHVSFVSTRVNSLLGELSKDKPVDQLAILRTVLSRVPDIIRASFDYTDRVESNINVTFNSYTNIREKYIAHVNSKEEILEETLVEEIDNIAPDTQEASVPEEKKLRKIGERPVHHLKERSEKNE